MIRVSGLSTLANPELSFVNVSFDVPNGAVTCLVVSPPRSASSLADLVVGLAKPSAGTVAFDGLPLSQCTSPRSCVGVVAQSMSAHPRRTVRDHLRWIGTSGGYDVAQVMSVLELTGLAPLADTYVSDVDQSVSKRLIIAGALIGTPKNLVIDDPFSGLDVESAGWFKRYLRHYSAAGNAVLVTGDKNSDAASIADRLVTIGDQSVVEVSDATTSAPLVTTSAAKGW